MIPGRRYRFTIEDCCVKGFLVGTFLRADFSDESVVRFFFDTGEIEVFAHANPKFEEIE